MFKTFSAQEGGEAQQLHFWTSHSISVSQSGKKECDEHMKSHYYLQNISTLRKPNELITNATNII